MYYSEKYNMDEGQKIKRIVKNTQNDNHEFIDKIINDNAIHVLQKLQSNSIDLVVTSPPYDNARDYNGYNFDFETFQSISNELYRVMKRGGVIVWVVGDTT